MTAPGEPVATMHGGGITLLYYCNRPGWFIAPETDDLKRALEECRRQGARWLVVAGPEGEDTRLDGRIGRAPVEVGSGYRIYALAEH